MRISNRRVYGRLSPAAHNKQNRAARIARMNTHLQPYRRAICSTSARLALAALVCTLYVGPVHAADAVKSSEKPQSGKLTIDAKEIQKPWTGDLDGMLKRRVIRVLTVYGKAFYFDIQRFKKHGIIYEAFHLFEEDLNKKLAGKDEEARRNISRFKWFLSRSAGTNCCRRWLPARAISGVQPYYHSENDNGWWMFLANEYQMSIELAGPASPAGPH